jgi:hypothetical protein
VCGFGIVGNQYIYLTSCIDFLRVQSLRVCWCEFP